VEEHKPPRYFIEDYGRNGLELTVEVPGMKARDIDVEIVQKDGVNTIAVNGSPGIRRRRGSAARSTFSKSFVIDDDDDIDVDGITARVSSGNLVISLPRKVGGYGNRVIPSVVKDRSFADNSNSGDESLVYDAKRRSLLGGNKRSARQAVIVEEPVRKTSEKSNAKKREENSQDDDDLYISEEEDIW
jgi:HSP20 family molecular chaperone IbpA